MTKINFSIFNRSAFKYQKKNPHNRRFVNYSAASDFILLFDDSDVTPDYIEKVVAGLKKEGKKVSAFVYTSQKVLPESSLPEIVFFNKKMINLFQKPQKELLEKMKSKKYDILIDLSLNQVIPLLYMSLYADAPLKVSSKLLPVELFDFILDIERQKNVPADLKGRTIVQFLYDEIIFYLKSIQTND